MSVAALPAPPWGRVEGLPAPPPRAVALDASAGRWAARLVLGARFLSLLYLFVLVYLALAVASPAAVLGWRPLSVVSGSMQPAIPPGSMVMVRPAEPDRFYASPSILAFADPNRPGQLLTHRVVDTASHDGTVVYTTRGDANRVADSGSVAHGDVVGAVRMVIPYVGLPSLWIHQGQPVLLAAWVLTSLMAIGTLLVPVRP